MTYCNAQSARIESAGAAGAAPLGDSPLKTAASQPLADERVIQRVRLRTFLTRRRRVLRSFLFFAVVSAGIFYLAIMQRDAQTLRLGEQQAQAIVDALQQTLDREHRLAMDFPTLAPPYSNISIQWQFNFFYGNALAASRTIGVCTTRSETHLFLSPDGRFVVLFDGRRFFYEWELEEEFSRRASDLGFAALLP